MNSKPLTIFLAATVAACTQAPPSGTTSQAATLDDGGSTCVSGGSDDGGAGNTADAGSGSSAPSPSCTTITQPGESIVDSDGNTWTLAGPSTDLLIDVNGQPAGVSADVTRLVYVNGVVSQQNVWGDWWSWGSNTWNSEADPTGPCGGGAPDSGATPPPTGGAPSPAAGAGYTTRTYGPDVTLGSNWVKSIPDSTAVQNGDGSVSVAGPWHFNDLVTTSGIIAFGGGGYFEATLSWDNPNAGWSVNQTIGWPSWWANTIEGRSVPFADTRGIEVDFLEAMGAGDDATWSSGMWDWYATGGPQSAGAVVDMPNGETGHELHRYGFLWVPASAGAKGRGEYYLDGVHVPEKDRTWDVYDTNSAPPYTDGTTMFACLDVQHIYLMFGTGASNPMTVTKVEVWQANDASNIHY